MLESKYSGIKLSYEQEITSLVCLWKSSEECPTRQAVPFWSPLWLSEKLHNGHKCSFKKSFLERMTCVLCLELGYLLKEHSLICKLAEFSDNIVY